MAGAASSSGKGSAVKAGNAFVEIGGKKTQLEKVLKSIEKDFQALGKRLSKIGIGVAAIGTAIAAPLELLRHHAIAAGNAADDMAQRLGTSAETVTSLTFAAELAGSSIQDVESSLANLQRVIAAGAAKGDKFYQSLMAEGLDVQLGVIADRIAAIENPTEQAAAAAEVFGRSGRRMLPFLREGAAGLAKLRAEADRAGATISTSAASTAARVGRAYELIQVVIGSVGRALGTAIMGDPERIDAIADRVMAFGVTLRKFIQENAEVIRIVAMVAAGMAVAGTAITALGVVCMSVGAIIGTFSAAIAAAVAVIGFLFTPLGALVVGLGSLGTGIGMSIAESERFAAALEFLGRTFSQVWAGMRDAVAGGDLSLALEIAWVGIQVAAEKGIGELEKLWIRFKFFFFEVWQQMKQAPMLVLAGMGSLFDAAITGIADGINFLIRQLNRVVENYNAIARKVGIDFGFVKAGMPTLGTLGEIGRPSEQNILRDEVARQNREIAALQRNKQEQLDAAGVVDPATQARLDELTARARQAAEEADRRKAEGAVAEAVRTSGLLQAVGEAVASAVKGSFAGGADRRSFTYGDQTQDVAKNTARTADGVEKLLDEVRDMQPEFT